MVAKDDVDVINFYFDINLCLESNYGEAAHEHIVRAVGLDFLEGVNLFCGDDNPTLRGGAKNYIVTAVSNKKRIATFKKALPVSGPLTRVTTGLQALENEPLMMAAAEQSWPKTVDLTKSLNGLWDEAAIAATPRQYGKMSFVFADPSAPTVAVKRSMDGVTEVDTNSAWLDYVASSFPEIRTRGGRALTVTTSFADTAGLAERARALGLDEIIEHRRGRPLAECLDALQLSGNGILLSPAAWSGVNLPGVLSHLVIPRIPFSRPDQEAQRRKEASLVGHGFASKQAKQIIQDASRYEASRKLRQGIGRGVRCATDEVTLWMLDPRVPLPYSVAQRLGISCSADRRWFATFLDCIPERFTTGLRGTLHEAQIHLFGKNIAA